MTTDLRPITPTDLVAVREVGDVQLSPDGTLIAFTVGDSFKEGRSAVWLVPADGARPARQFTGGPHDDSPRWSPDGHQLAFVSDRSGSGQLYLLDIRGGEARQLTSVSGDISSPAWSPDGQRIGFLLTDAPDEAERARLAASGDAIEFERHPAWQRVWAVAVDGGPPQRLTEGEQQVWEFSWRPDGGLALVCSDAAYEWSWFQSYLALLGPGGGRPQQVFRHPEKQLANPCVSPDGQHVAFLSAIWSDRGTNAGDVWLLPLDGGPARNLTEGGRTSVWWHQWRGSGGLETLGFLDGDASVGRVDLEGDLVTSWRGGYGFAEGFGGAHIGADGTLAVARSGPAEPYEVWVARPDGAELAWTQLTDLHCGAQVALGETRLLHWQSADGVAVQGQLILPLGYQPGQRVPLVVWVHGGPAWLYSRKQLTGAWFPQHAFAAQGYAVLMPNPRGSAGFGVEFTEAAIGDFGGGDWQDVLSGVDFVVAQGIADPARLAIGGWSYGGYMAAWAITQTERFKAAIVGAGITHWRSFHGQAEIGSWDQIGLRASPYQPGNSYDTRSPLSYVERVSAATLIVHGEADNIVPVGQGYELFRALKDLGVPTELVVYPRAGHGLNERAQLEDRLRRYLEWFARWL